MFFIISFIDETLPFTASSDKRQDAYPLPRKRRQSAAVPEGTARAFREHGLPRYRRWEPQAQPRTYLDHHP